MLLATNSVNRFLYLCGESWGEATALMLRSLARYSVYADAIQQLDPAAATANLPDMRMKLRCTLPKYSQLAVYIPQMDQDIREQLCQGDYIQIVGAFVLHRLRRGKK